VTAATEIDARVEIRELNNPHGLECACHVWPERVATHMLLVYANRCSREFFLCTETAAQLTEGPA